MKTLTEQIRYNLDAINEASNFPDPDDYADENDFMQAVQQVPVADIIDGMNNNQVFNEYFPSGWDYTFHKVPYPGYLAEALIQSKSAESVSDLWNVYYGSRVLSPEAHKIFADASLSGTETILSDYLGSVSPDEFLIDPYVSGLYKNEPELFDKIAQAQLSDEDYSDVFGRRKQVSVPDSSTQQVASSKTPSNINDIDSAIANEFSKNGGDVKGAANSILQTVFSNMYQNAGGDPTSGDFQSFYDSVLNDYVDYFNSDSERRIVLRKAIQKLNN